MMIATLAALALAAAPSPVDDIYATCLGRAPESVAIVDYWESHPDPSSAICTSPEAVAHLTPHGLTHFSSSTWMPHVMADVRWCESRDDYTAENQRSSAAGAWQMIQSTSDEAARRMGRADLIGVTASQWSRVDQDRGAAHVLQFQGLSAWAASKGCHS